MLYTFFNDNPVFIRIFFIKFSMGSNTTNINSSAVLPFRSPKLDIQVYLDFFEYA